MVGLGCCMCSPDREAPPTLSAAAAAASQRLKVALSPVQQLSTELIRLALALLTVPSTAELQVLHRELSQSLQQDDGVLCRRGGLTLTGGASPEVGGFLRWVET